MGQRKKELQEDLDKRKKLRELFDRYVAEYIRKYGSSQAHVATLLGAKNRSTLTRWLNGETKTIPKTALEKAITLFELNIQQQMELLDVAGYVISPSSDTSPPASEQESNISHAKDLHAYLQHIIDTNQWLLLLGGSAIKKVPLERIYVSLCADEIHPLEREVEREKLLKFIESLHHETALFRQGAGELGIDPYTEFALIHKAILCDPERFMLKARHWPKLFFETHQQKLLNLVEVVVRHPWVVILGDPGSGKTTLGKWLMVQFARAFLENKSQVEIQASLVHPGAKEEELLNLGPVLFPIFVRIADYARVRWHSQWGPSDLSLEQFIVHGQYQYPHSLPVGLTQEVVGSLARDYLAQRRALIVLDGLDEVANPRQRQMVMQAIKDFLQAQQIAPSQQRASNHIVLTSRIVGYQFDPLTNLSHYMIEEMNEQAITAFCHAWMGQIDAISSDQVIELAEKLKRAIFDQAHPSIRVLASNPLFLTLLAQLYWNSQERALPTERIALFEEAVGIFYHQREDHWQRLDISLTRLTRALGAVAIHIHANEPSDLVEEGIIRRCLRDEVLFNDEQVEEIIKAARDVSGFLVAKGEGIYGFLHRALQEYFVACHLSKLPYQQLVDQLVAQWLNPLWREPVILTIGLVSQPRHEKSHQLQKLFAELLETPDPVGDVLPRRELMVASTWAECKSIPSEIGYKVIYRLLEFYFDIVGRESVPAQQLIWQTFTALRRSSIAPQVEIVLVAAIQGAIYKHRWAAGDILIETQWDSPALTEAFIHAWRTYAGPAGMMLVALEGILERHPEYFTENLLPIRQIKEYFNRDWLPIGRSEAAKLWQNAQATEELKAILHALYVPPGTDIHPNLVNRESPLTAHMLSTFGKIPLKPEIIENFQQEILHLAKRSSSASARDVALALSALGNADWMPTWMTLIKDQNELVRSVLASLTYMNSLSDDLAYHFHVAHTFDPILASVDVLVRVFDHDRTHTFDHLRASVDALVSALHHASSHISNVAQILGDYMADDPHPIGVGDPIRDPSRASARRLDLVSLDDFDLSYGYPLAYYLAFPLTNMFAIERQIYADRSHWTTNNANYIKILDLLLIALQTLQQQLVSLEPSISVWAALLTFYVKPPPKIALQSEGVSKWMGTKLSFEDLSRLINDFDSLDDEQHEQARSSLSRERKASEIGLPLIEHIATFATVSEMRVPIRTQLILTLQNIVHNEPAWVKSWITQAHHAEGTTSAETILANMYTMTLATLKILLQELPQTSSRLKCIGLQSLKWMVRLNTLREGGEAILSVYESLLTWLDQETDSSVRCAIIEVLCSWQPKFGFNQDLREREMVTLISRVVLNRLQNLGKTEEVSWFYVALARIACLCFHMGMHVSEQATFHSNVIRPIRGMLIERWSESHNAAAFVRFIIAEAIHENTTYWWDDEQKNREVRQKIAREISMKLAGVVFEPVFSLAILLDAGSDDDLWNDQHHGVLAVAISQLLIDHSDRPDLRQVLLERIQDAIEKQDWQLCRIGLAAVTACIEIVPAWVQSIAQDKLEGLLIKAATDAENSTSRRYALTALSYLGKVTTNIVEALLAGCRDIREVQQAAIEAAGRFRSIEGDIISNLVPFLTGESVNRAYTVIQLLAALGTSVAAERAEWRGQIIEALANALKDPGSRRRTVFPDKFRQIGEPRTTLKKALYTALLQVAGWAE